ncbi:uncharacterized protein F5147DRAFT_591979 [Suillus discolor]|uniref:Uncharacterized protein n=1 Tax=Suillus discolor TaxID=1912936 RepID=A0A9P7JKW1_9AGAM|nr:uncharacterized protein F5147DRAFT_591979 [Suillus discolor]KAG2079839.1 hypothetical protein F5147DRAFT_591979 [Suillus discolor]
MCLHQSALSKCTSELNFSFSFALSHLRSFRYACRSHRFMDGYHKGLTGKQAAWATKIYKGYQVLPNSILAELENAGL